jgi:hypothetical protein
VLKVVLCEATKCQPDSEFFAALRSPVGVTAAASLHDAVSAANAEARRRRQPLSLAGRAGAASIQVPMFEEGMFDFPQEVRVVFAAGEEPKPGSMIIETILCFLIHPPSVNIH